MRAAAFKPPNDFGFTPKAMRGSPILAWKPTFVAQAVESANALGIKMKCFMCLGDTPGHLTPYDDDLRHRRFRCATTGESMPQEQMALCVANVWKKLPADITKRTAFKPSENDLKLFDKLWQLHQRKAQPPKKMAEITPCPPAEVVVQPPPAAPNPPPAPAAPQFAASQSECSEPSSSVASAPKVGSLIERALALPEAQGIDNKMAQFLIALLNLFSSEMASISAGIQALDARISKTSEAVAKRAPTYASAAASLPAATSRITTASSAAQPQAHMAGGRKYVLSPENLDRLHRGEDMVEDDFRHGRLHVAGLPVMRKSALRQAMQMRELDPRKVKDVAYVRTERLYEMIVRKRDMEEVKAGLLRVCAGVTFPEVAPLSQWTKEALGCLIRELPFSASPQFVCQKLRNHRRAAAEQVLRRKEEQAKRVCVAPQAAAADAAAPAPAAPAKEATASVPTTPAPAKVAVLKRQRAVRAPAAAEPVPVAPALAPLSEKAVAELQAARDALEFQQMLGVTSEITSDEFSPCDCEAQAEMSL